MRTVKHIQKAPGLPDVACGCEYAVDGDREEWTKLCIPHFKEFTMRRASAAHPRRYRVRMPIAIWLAYER